MQEFTELPSKERTEHLSVLIGPKTRACFEALCKVEDVTPSQVVCQLIQEYIEARVGPEWQELILSSSDNEL
jgi:hypothetical protein